MLHVFVWYKDGFLVVITWDESGWISEIKPRFLKDVKKEFVHASFGNVSILAIQKNIIYGLFKTGTIDVY